MYKSVVPFSRFSMFTKRQKIQLPAAILTYFLCALTVFCVNVHHFPLIVSVGIPSLGRSELIFIDPGINTIRYDTIGEFNVDSKAEY